MKLKAKTLEALKVVISGQFHLPSNKYLHYCLFVLFLGFLYITNHLCVESDLREIAELTNDIKELRYESISTSSELMNMSKQSEVIRRVEAEGLDLKELTEPPRILEMK
ncbi:MAG: hypothetical protein J6Y82_08345 [Bacteroidales bacterium]|nr:hypothetical protein [Bacteroidales bacterium]